jgi:hypothetical protein
MVCTIKVAKTRLAFEQDSRRVTLDKPPVPKYDYAVKPLNIREAVEDRDDGLVTEFCVYHILHDGFCCFVDAAKTKLVSHNRMWRIGDKV